MCLSQGPRLHVHRRNFIVVLQRCCSSCCESCGVSTFPAWLTAGRANWSISQCTWRSRCSAGRFELLSQKALLAGRRYVPHSGMKPKLAPGCSAARAGSLARKWSSRMQPFPACRLALQSCVVCNMPDAPCASRQLALILPCAC